MSKTSINAIVEMNWDYQGTRFRPFALSIPPPLFPSK